jgi:hypothetical protein
VNATLLAGEADRLQFLASLARLEAGYLAQPDGRRHAVERAEFVEVFYASSRHDESGF